MQCTARAKSTQQQCKRAAVPGANVCVKHGGGAPQVQRAAARRLALGEAHAELQRLGHPVEIDPSEAMLEMVFEAAGNVAVLRRLVQDLEHRFLSAEAPTIVEFDSDTDKAKVVLDPDVARQQDALVKAGIAGFTGSEKKPNEALPHVFVVMYNDERERLVRWSKACRDAGVDERRVELAEKQARLMADAFRQVLDGFMGALIAAGLAPDVVRGVYRDQVPGLVRAALTATSSRSALESAEVPV
jgi:hypothetical protein